MEYKLDDFYNMLNPKDNFYYKDILDKENYSEKYSKLYLKKDSLKNYIDGISWVSNYYFGIKVDETWCYKYGRSPLLSQVVKYMESIKEFKIFENKNLDLRPLSQVIFITPFNYNKDIMNQIKFINYKDKEKLIVFIKNNKHFYYDLDIIYKDIISGDNNEIDCSTSIFLSKCHLHFLENNVNINDFINKFINIIK